MKETQFTKGQMPHNWKPVGSVRMNSEGYRDIKVNKIEDLRDELFATLRELRSKESPMDIDRAKAVAEVAKVIVDSAKVEVDHMKLAGGTSSFLPAPEEPKAGAPRLIKGNAMSGSR
jgi:hypothetical protein